MTDNKKNETKSNPSFLTVIFGGLLLVAIAVAVYFFYQNSKEVEARVKAQNEVAKLSQIVEEKEGLVSRLSQQALTQREIQNLLSSQNEDLSKLIKSRDEQILALSQAVINFRPTRIIIRDSGNIHETPEGDRIRVSFDQTQDPVRVAGFTLTNPAEAEVNVSFVRPMRVSTTVTQQSDGSWRTYLQTDWPVDVQSLETTVHPLPVAPLPNISKWMVGGYLGLNVIPFSVQADVSVLYKFGRFYIGPGLGVFLSGQDSGVNLGAAIQYQL